MLAQLAPTRAVLPERGARVRQSSRPGAAAETRRASAPLARGRPRRARSAIAAAGKNAMPMSRGWRTPAMAVFWDLDNLRPPSGYETLWAYRLVEAAFEFADLVHVRAYAREGTVDAETEKALTDVGVTFTRCPTVREGADVVLSTDVTNLVRGGGRLESDATNPHAKDNEAAKAVASAESFAVMVCTRDEGMAECVAFAKARRDLCDAAVVAGEFVAKNMHRPQFARALGAGAGDVGITEGYWRVMTHVAGKTDEGILGKSRLVRAADATVLWDSKRLFDMPGGGNASAAAETEATKPGATPTPTPTPRGEWEVGDLDAVDAAAGGVAAMFRDGAFEPWPPGTPVPE